MHVWVVTWGKPGRVDWRAVLVRAFDADEALSVAADAYPDLLPPDAAVLASDALAQSVGDDLTSPRCRPIEGAWPFPKT